MSWLGRIRQLFMPPCQECGGPTEIEREVVLSTIPAVFEVYAWCPNCGEIVSRRQVVDCLQ